ncbi:MAG: class I SAM-dependent methyltransferase [Burkholderiaceae bacterium]|jgi:SAM-dependent methyltransferase
MSSEIIGLRVGLHDWLASAPGQHLLAWERACFDVAVSDLFGYHALQLGLPEVDALQTNRMPHQWLAMPDAAAAAALGHEGGVLSCDFTALPFPENSLDLVVLPHTLDLSADPHATLREVERVLVPDGRVIVCGFNPASLWGLRQRRAELYRRWGAGQGYLPEDTGRIGYWRLRDWLRLLSFEVESAQFGCWRPAVRSDQWLQRTAWMDTLGSRWWPIFGAAYFLVAVKRVQGMRLVTASWKGVRARAPAPVAVGHPTRQHRDRSRRAPRA